MFCFVLEKAYGVFVHISQILPHKAFEGFLPFFLPPILLNPLPPPPLPCLPQNKVGRSEEQTAKRHILLSLSQLIAAAIMQAGNLPHPSLPTFLYFSHLCLLHPFLHQPGSSPHLTRTPAITCQLSYTFLSSTRSLESDLSPLL